MLTCFSVVSCAAFDVAQRIKTMSREHTVVGIDIGSYYTHAVVASFHQDVPVPQIVGVARSRTQGIRKGSVIDLEDATRSAGKALAEAERASGSSIEEVFVSISGDHIVALPSRGVIAVSRADGEITHDDVDRVIQAASTIALPQNREILHNLPKEYMIDGEGGLRDVVGMNGLRLETNTLIISGSSSHMKNIARIMQGNNVATEGFVLAPIAAARAVLSKRQKELGVVCVDIGGGTTNIAVFEEGNLIHANVLPLGGENITNDLAIGLKVDVEIAERIKREYGMALTTEVSARDKIDLSQFDPEVKETVSRKDIVEIIEARLAEIFDLVNTELRQINKEAFLPGGSVLVGGTAKIPHVVDLAREKLHLPTQIGFPREVEGITGSVDDPTFATVLGLVFWGLEDGGVSKRGFSLPSIGGFHLSAVWAKIKKFIRALLP